MHVIRPIRIEDLDSFSEFAFAANFGITSMPRNREMLKEKIEHSLKAFQTSSSGHQGGKYLFVLEDTESQEVGGVCGIISRTGTLVPKYYYQKETIHKKDIGLPIPENLDILRPITLVNGPTEIGTLFLAQSFRKEGLGRLLSLSRFLFIASFSDRFEKTIMADMRGFVDKDNNAPFWEHFGRRFLNLDFNNVMQLLEKGKEFIPHILPDYPIYLTLLHTEVLSTIGKVHFNTEPALHMLLNEGFSKANLFDVFDGGPVINAPQEKIRAIRETQMAQIADITHEEITSNPFILCNNQLDFRACYSNLTLNKENNVRIPKKVAKALKLAKGDSVRFIPLHPHKRTVSETH